jgi:formylglycine-generating enzyme
MAKTLITRGLYRSVIGGYPQWLYFLSGRRLPVNHVSWEDAVRFCNALSRRSGRSPCYRETGGVWACDWTADGYRLPTEAEWEYACRAGTTAPWFWGTDPNDAERYAWYSRNSGWKVHPVGGKEANDWGLYDMAGNCWEWCWDWYGPYDPKAVDNPLGPGSGRERVLRGGSFVNVPGRRRSAIRDGRTPENRNGDIGFRCVRGAGRQPVVR